MPTTTPTSSPTSERQDCGTAELQQADYRGSISVTEYGLTCQRWDSQSPHEHTRIHQEYPESGLVQNYCRNPDGEPRAWCYTTDPDVRWQYCDVPTCTGPTAEPTSTPTAKPTESPTGAPTGLPTSGPTGAPIETPTAGPTGAPSAAPTAGPTSAPLPSLTTANVQYTDGDIMTFTYNFPNGNKGSNAWVGIYKATEDPLALPSEYLAWNYVCSSSKSSSCAGHQDSGTMTIEASSNLVGNFELKAFLIEDGSSGSSYVSVAATSAFTVRSAPTAPPTSSPTSSPTVGADNEFCQALALDEDNHCGTEKDGEPKIMMCYYDGKKNRNRSKCESPSDIEEKYQSSKKYLLHCGCCVVPDEISAGDQDSKCPAPTRTRRLNLRPRGV